MKFLAAFLWAIALRVLFEWWCARANLRLVRQDRRNWPQLTTQADVRAAGARDTLWSFGAILAAFAAAAMTRAAWPALAELLGRLAS